MKNFKRCLGFIIIMSLMNCKNITKKEDNCNINKPIYLGKLSQTDHITGKLLKVDSFWTKADTVCF